MNVVERAYEVQKIVLINVPRGSDLVDYISSYAYVNKIYTGVVFVIGSLYDVVLGYYSVEKDEYLRIRLNGYYELVSGVGNISLRENKPFLHLHVALGDENGRLYGGHLISGKVFVAETKIFVLKGEPMNREKTTNTLWLWH